MATIALALACALALTPPTGRTDPVTPPDPGSEPPGAVLPAGALGVVEVTLTGVTTPTASAATQPPACP